MLWLIKDIVKNFTKDSDIFKKENFADIINFANYISTKNSKFKSLDIDVIDIIAKNLTSCKIREFCQGKEEKIVNLVIYSALESYCNKKGFILPIDDKKETKQPENILSQAKAVMVNLVNKVKVQIQY